MQNGKIKVCTCVVMGPDFGKRSLLDPGLHVVTDLVWSPVKFKTYKVGNFSLIARANFVAMVP